jgi:hypothetical protein
VKEDAMTLLNWLRSLFHKARARKASDLIETGVWYPIFRDADGTAYVVAPDRRKQSDG